MAKERLPNWAKWNHIPEVMLWQAIALSLNIDPDVAERSYSWKAEGTLTNESKDFKDRLDVLLANFGRHPLLKPTRLSLSDREEGALLLSLFAAWAASLGWSIPPELKALGVDAQEPQPADSDFGRWAIAQLWTLLEAAYLLSGELPPAARKGLIRCTATPLTDEDLQLEGLIGRSEVVYRELKDATDLAQLEFIESRTGSIGNRRVEPANCIAWAISRGMHVPECFTTLASQSAKSAERSSLHPKEKESLLKLVATMAIKTYGYDPRAARNDTARRISEDATALGLSIDVDTVKKWLDRAAELVSQDALGRVLDAKKGR
jgi:hypothetical protein